MYLRTGLAAMTAALATGSAAEVDFTPIMHSYQSEVRPILEKYCYDCHSADEIKGDVNFEQYNELTPLRRDAQILEKSLEMLHLREMPPKKKSQPTGDERALLENWLKSFLNAEGKSQAGDPGRVVMRRLNNVEYTRTIQDLTGVALDPAKEFPIDGAAGEGFINSGEALAMSPALLEKYFTAAKGIADHAILLPDGFQFSASERPGDWTEEWLKKIRDIYAKYATTGGGTPVNLQGVVFDTNSGGQIPLATYFAATLESREALFAGNITLEQVANNRQLNIKYFTSIWNLLTGPDTASPILEDLRTRWKNPPTAGAAALTNFVEGWQQTLTRFQNVGHMKRWAVPVLPVAARQELRQKVSSTGEKDRMIRLISTDAGDGAAGDIVIWDSPKLLRPGRPDLLLRDLRPFLQDVEIRRAGLASALRPCLTAAVEAATGRGTINPSELAARHQADPELLTQLLAYLRIAERPHAPLNYFTTKFTDASGQVAVQGWGSPETPFIIANSSAEDLQIPGRLKPHGVVVHPSPALHSVVGWQSPVDGLFRIEAQVARAHLDCGNGVSWSLDLRRGSVRTNLATGGVGGAEPVIFGPLENINLQAGDMISLAIGPKDQNHNCDLTSVDINIKEIVSDPATDPTKEWNLARDICSEILAANPHADSLGNPSVWHFYTEPVAIPVRPGWEIPAASLLENWNLTAAEPEKIALNERLLALLASSSTDSMSPVDAALYHQLRSLTGPFGKWLETSAVDPSHPRPVIKTGLDPAVFGLGPDGQPVDPNSLCVQSPAIVDIHFPADFVDAEIVTGVSLHPTLGLQGSVQVECSTGSFSNSSFRSKTLFVANDGSPARTKLETAFSDFRQSFPAAICYPKIIPADEVITLTVFHREDEELCRLMLNDVEKAELDRLWDELHYIGQDALTMVDAYEQLLEYAGQEGSPAQFSHLREPVEKSAEVFKKQLLASEKPHLTAITAFAEKAFRQPLKPGEGAGFEALYHRLRDEEVPHEEAVRLTLTRILMSPTFLYRNEKPVAGDQAAPVSNWELASRLSYLLWSSMPDETLLAQAATGRLTDTEVVISEARRMLKDDRSRALASEFACQWLHIRDFDSLDEKSETLFPEFKELRGDMYEESMRFFQDLFQQDGSVLRLLNADYTFLNERLAKHYGIPGVTGPEWRRVEGVQRYGRGGILGFATVLTKQAGASRSSPILRGNWIVETLLGDKLPKPPANIPLLPESELDGPLTMRQITELHTQAPECASCHQRIDPFGFALEGYDAIGRFRDIDGAGRKIDTTSHLTWKDQATFDGLTGLREYLTNQRRDEVIHTFCRKLLGYALGRSIKISDGPVLEEMKSQLAAHDYRFSAALETILRSPQFLNQRGLEATHEEKF